MANENQLVVITDEKNREFQAYGFVYITTNLINGKKYVGSKVFSYPDGHKNRWDSYLGSGKALKSAIRKYGKDSFYKNIIYITTSIEELEQMETYYILLFDAANSVEWYNLKEGSRLIGNPLAGKSKEEIDEIKIKVGKASKGRKKIKMDENNELTKESENYIKNVSEHVAKIWSNRTPEQKKGIGTKIGYAVKKNWENKTNEEKEIFSKKISESVKGEKNGFYGKTHSEEVRKKQSARMSGDNSRFAKPIFIYNVSGELLKEFGSIKSASEYLVSKGLIKTVNGGKSAIRRTLEKGEPFYGMVFRFGHERIK